MRLGRGIISTISLSLKETGYPCGVGFNIGNVIYVHGVASAPYERHRFHTIRAFYVYAETQGHDGSVIKQGKCLIFASPLFKIKNPPCRLPFPLGGTEPGSVVSWHLVFLLRVRHVGVCAEKKKKNLTQRHNWAFYPMQSMEKLYQGGGWAPSRPPPRQRKIIYVTNGHLCCSCVCLQV